MNHTTLTILWRIVSRNLAVILLLVISVGAFATLGDGKKSDIGPKGSLLSNRTTTPGRFSLKSGYSFRGNQVINTSEKYITLNTVATYQKGHTTYILPLKKKVILEKITFNPNAATRNY